MNATDPFDGKEIDSLFKTVLEHSFEAIVITDAVVNRNNIIYANDKFCQMTGYQRNELYGKNPRILQGKRSNIKVIKRLKQAISSFTPFVGATFNYRKDGSVYPVQWNVYPVFNAQGEAQYFVSIQQDLSALRSSLARLKSSSEHFKNFLNELITQGEALEKHIETAKQDIIENSELLFQYVRKPDNKEESLIDDFFDFDDVAQNSASQKIERERISAADFRASSELDPDIVKDIIDLSYNLTHIVEIESLVDINEVRRKEFVTDLQELANAIFYVEEFLEISISMSELAVAMMHIADKPYDIIVAEAINGLIGDLGNWVQQVFIDCSSNDIHWLDDSIIGSCSQLMVFCRIDDHDNEEDELW
ncbi:PAS domain S-box protein [Alteromonas sp. ASW11-36]|uniref:PAS domain S-box protein n=1 Tax=Alteromonas arenosi TaxID=3055817 RepID=A0ABT7T0F9_9ALTE|nr:PAS domain S-box protein [Alteromonas sp. ASW11-36]MDM7861903.1 PAS domain S-box protein [Alteromonas sp. ASW11-36]